MADSGIFEGYFGLKIWIQEDLAYLRDDVLDRRRKGSKGKWRWCGALAKESCSFPHTKHRESIYKTYTCRLLFWQGRTHTCNRHVPAW